MTLALRWAVGAIFIFYSMWKNKVTINTDESPTFQVKGELSKHDQTKDYLLTRLKSYYLLCLKNGLLRFHGFYRFKRNESKLS